MQVPGGSRLVGLTLNRKGNFLLVNCYDRSLRLYSMARLDHTHARYETAQIREHLAQNKVGELCILLQHTILTAAGTAA